MGLSAERLPAADEAVNDSNPNGMQIAESKKKLYWHTLTYAHSHAHTHTHNPQRQQVHRLSDTSDEGSPVARLSEEDAAFCTRFQLSFEELPLPGWQSGGKRCSVLDRDRPLIGTKGGRLFLTHRLVFVCKLFGVSLS